MQKLTHIYCTNLIDTIVDTRYACFDDINYVSPHSPLGSADYCEDVNDVAEIRRTKVELTVADLSYHSNDYKYRLYQWNLIPIAIFYALPVIQLVAGYNLSVTCSFNLSCTCLSSIPAFTYSSSALL